MRTRIENRSRLKVSVLAFVVATIGFLLVVCPIDIANTRSFLYYSSFFYLSLNPNAYYIIPTPPIFLSILLPQFYVYIFTFNLRFASFFFALINLIFSVFSSIIIMRIVFILTKKREKATSAFYVMLFSPFLFFINYIFIEQDIYAIFLTLSSFYLLYFERKVSLRVAGAFLLAYATFFYYFPVLIIPSLIIYEKGWRERLTTLSLLIFTLSFLYISFLRNVLWSILGNGAGAISASSVGLPVFDILNVFQAGIALPLTPLTSEIYRIILFGVVALVFIIPIVFRVFKKSIILPLLVTFSLIFLFLKIYNGDEFIWIIPFASIAIAYYSNNRLLKTKLFLSQLYMVPLIIVFNMWASAGYGYGTGVFYLTYMTFHLPITVYSLIPHYVLVNKILDIATFVLILMNIFYVLILSRKMKETSLKSIEDISFINNRKVKRISAIQYDIKPHYKFREMAYKKLLNAQKQWTREYKTKIKIIVVLVMLILIGTAGLGSYHISDQSNIIYSKGAFPLGLFISSNALMVNGLSYNYMRNSSFIQISNYTGNLVPLPIFSRNITDQEVYLNMEIIPLLRGGMIYSDLVAGFNGLGIYALNRLELPKDYSIVTPVTSRNLSLPLNQELNIVNATTVPTFTMNGTSMEEYNLSISVNTTYILGFYHSPVNQLKNVVFYSQMDGVSYEFFYFQNSLIFGFLSNGSWNYEFVNPIDYSTSWNIVSFSMINDSISFFINGLNIFSYKYNISYIVSNNTYVGMSNQYSSAIEKFPFSGEVTPLFSIKTTSVKTQKNLELIGSGEDRLLPFASNNITIKSNEHSVSIVTSGTSAMVNGSFSSFWFGRNSQYSPGVEYAFHYLRINSTTSNGLFLKIIVLLYVIPLLVIGLVTMEAIKFRNSANI